MRWEGATWNFSEPESWYKIQAVTISFSLKADMQTLLTIASQQGSPRDRYIFILISEEGLDDKQDLQNRHQPSGVSATTTILERCASDAASQSKAACSLDRKEDNYD
jgi:hypothetical protein